MLKQVEPASIQQKWSWFDGQNTDTSFLERRGLHLRPMTCSTPVITNYVKFCQNITNKKITLSIPILQRRENYDEITPRYLHRYYCLKEQR